MLGKAFKKAVTKPVTGKNLTEKQSSGIVSLLMYVCYFSHWAALKRWQISSLSLNVERPQLIVCELRKSQTQISRCCQAHGETLNSVSGFVLNHLLLSVFADV